jgi:hypothetical protein
VLGPESSERPVEEKQSPHSGSKKGSSSTDHDGGSSSDSAGKNGSEGGRGNQLINCNRFTKAQASGLRNFWLFFKIFFI